MKCYKMPFSSFLANYSLLGISLIGLYLSFPYAMDSPHLTILLAGLSFLFAMNAVWLKEYSICVSNSQVVFFLWFNRVTELQLIHVVECRRSRKGLPSIASDDLILVDFTGKIHKVPGDMDGSPELIGFIEQRLADVRSSASRLSTELN